MTEPSFVQLVTQALMGADRPLTVAEIKARVEMIRPVRTRDPQATIRGAINNVPLAASLGGRPARYTWWPRHLAGNAFRQPLAASDLEVGTLVLNDEIRIAMRPDLFPGSSRSSGEVTLVMSPFPLPGGRAGDGGLADGPVLRAHIEHLVAGQAVWGLPPTPVLADWYRQQGATPDDALIVQVLDVEARRYAVALARRVDRDEDAIAARNQALADIADQVLRAARLSLPDFYLLPRLIAHDAYRHPLPPDPWEDVLRADLRFVVERGDANLTEKVVNDLERERAVPPDPWASPRPQGDRRKARSDKARRAWGAYLFDRGMDHLWDSWPVAAEAYYKEALRLDPGHADAWVHLGNRRFEEERVAEALPLYERGQTAAEARTIGDPARYPGPFWLDVDSRPFMRALHGRGLCLWRLGRVDEARQVFAWMLELNPNDNQGVRFLLHDLDEGLSWEESLVRDEERVS
ncbi:MAG: tetratricopeptide repeat protein [Anaerolineae bacterium]|nr:tetratricopeptide repeat protein [Anaerolineae bacterium]